MENVQLWETPWRAWDLSEVLEDGGISRSREEMKTQAEESKAVIMKKHSILRPSQRDLTRGYKLINVISAGTENGRVWLQGWEIRALLKVAESHQKKKKGKINRIFSSDVKDKQRKVMDFPSGTVQFSSVAQSCPTLCHPMNRSTPGLPVHHQLPEFTRTHIHQVSDAIQPSHPLLSPSPPAPNPSQHQSLFQWVNSSHEVAKVLEFQL